MKDKTVEELLEVVQDLQDRLTELEGGEFQFKEGDIVKVVDTLDHPLVMGEYLKVIRGTHTFCGAKWIDYIDKAGDENSCYTRAVELVWRDK